MPDSRSDERSERDLLNKIKEQYEGDPLRPRLFEVSAIHGMRLPIPTYEWMYSAGMGDYALLRAKPDEIRAIRSLLREGTIVPTLSQDFDMGSKTIRRIKHFDDVNFALDQNSSPIIFEYSKTKDMPDPIIRPDSAYDPVIKNLKHRLQYDTAVIDQSPILLNNGPAVWPILTSPHVIGLRDRQRTYNEHVHPAP